MNWGVETFASIDCGYCLPEFEDNMTEKNTLINYYMSDIEHNIAMNSELHI